ncbi:MAG: hypothetical protein WBK77_03485 [Alphaproteobacteria bacterium]
MQNTFNQLAHSIEPPALLLLEELSSQKLSGKFDGILQELNSMQLNFSLATGQKTSLIIAENTHILTPTAYKRDIPILMAHWSISGKGALNEKQKETLPEGDWGFFTPESYPVLHGYDPYNASVSIIITPGR